MVPKEKGLLYTNKCLSCLAFFFFFTFSKAQAIYYLLVILKHLGQAFYLFGQLDILYWYHRVISTKNRIEMSIY